MNYFEGLPKKLFADLDNLTVHSRQEGPAAAANLVFINSLGCDLRIWDAVALSFTDRFRILRYDIRGHGLTDTPPGPYSIEQLTNDLLRLLDYLNIQEATLIGISIGGQIALDFAARHPERVTSLVLCDTAPKVGTETLWEERITAVQKYGLESLAKSILSRWFTPQFIDRQPATYRGYTNMLSRMPASGYTATCAALRDADLRHCIGSIGVKSLIISGAEDRAVSPDESRELAGSLQDATFILIPGAGHLPCIERPAQMAEAIDGFLGEAVNA